MVVGLLDYRDDRGENKAFISIESNELHILYVYRELYTLYIYI